MALLTETITHAAACSLTLGRSPRGCTCGLWETMARYAVRDDMTLLGQLTQIARILIESASPDSLEWRLPDGAPWMLTVVTYNNAATESEELGEDEWLRYGGSDLGSAVRAAWEDLRPTKAVLDIDTEDA